MSKPEKIRIPHNELRFEHIGRLSHGALFMAYVTGTFSCRVPDRPQYWLAVLHLFNADGTHSQTLTLPPAPDPNDDASLEKAHAAFDGILSLLHERNPVFEDIWVKPFEIEIDGVLHGLIYEADDDPEDPGEWVMLEPRDIMFHPPWEDGEYST
jgi:hypothetical protein